jgi:dUTP pyrophosphatase
MHSLTCSLADDAVAPRRVRDGDAGYDLSALKAFALGPGERDLIDTGVSIALDSDTAALIVPRSGLAAKHGITVVNSPGLIDSGYRGALKIILLNTGSDRFIAQAGERIAQLVLIDVKTPPVAVVDVLPKSLDGRGVDGFGSSGTA